MKKMAGRLGLILCVLVLLVCQADFASADGETVRIVVWSFTNEMQGMIQRYYAPDHPEVEFEFQVYPTDGNMYTSRLDSYLSGTNALSDEAPDIFTLEASFVRQYVNSSATGDLAELGLGDEDYGSVYNPVLETGRNPATNEQKALSWQACPTVLVYRASLAEQYLGITSPEEFAARVSDLSGFLQTARDLRSASDGACKMITGTSDLFNAVANSDAAAWVVNGQLNITDEMYDLAELARILSAENLTQDSDAWSVAWFAGMRGELETMAYILPTWGLNYTLIPNCVVGWDSINPDSEENILNATENGTYGDWRVVTGPVQGNWGGTWLATNRAKVNQASAAKKAALRDLISFLTLNEDFLAQYAADSNDFVSNQDVVEDIIEAGTHEMEFFGGQDPFEALNLSAQEIHTIYGSQYDSTIRWLWQDYVVTPYANGEITDLTAAVQNFRLAVGAQFPELAGSRVCGDDLTWELSDSGVLTITGTGDMYDFDTARAPWYSRRDQIRSVVIGEGVTGIGMGAFEGCSSLTEVAIPASVTDIRANVFLFCTSLTAIQVDSANPAYSSAGGVLFNKNSTALLTCPAGIAGEFTVPAGVTSIADSAFRDCAGLTAVTLPEGVDSIGPAAFMFCDSLTSMTIPASVTSIGRGVFAYCSSLASITVAPGNTAYTIVNDALMNIGGTLLITCPADRPAGPYTVPDGVEIIDEWAFANVPLTAVTLPASLTVVKLGAFDGCLALEEVNYLGTVLQAEQIMIRSDNGPLQACVWTCADGTYSLYNTLRLDTPTEVTLGAGETVYFYFRPAENGTYHFVSSGDHDTFASLYAGMVANECQIASSDDDGENCNFDVVFEMSAGTDYYYGARFFSAEESGTFTVTLTRETPTEWTLSEGVLTISGEGPMNDFRWGTAPWYERREEITSLVVAEGVTSVGNFALQDCTNLTQVQLPSGLTSIGANAFNGCFGLAGIVIPDSVLSIQSGAFYYSGLTSVVIPDSVITIGDNVFGFCDSLTSIQVDSGNENYSSADGVLFNKTKTILIAAPAALAGNYAIPDGVITIDGYAFSDCWRLTGITIPDSVEYIGWSAFYCCSGLTSMDIPAGVTCIDHYAFAYCSSLTAISVSSDNQAFASVNGVLFDKSKTTLLVYPGGRTGAYTIPDSVNSIREGAFFACINLTSVAIPDGVTRIAYDTFNSCVNLTTVVLPGSITAIDDFAFGECDSLTDVWFDGTEAQWNAISVGSGNGYISTEMPHCITGFLMLPFSLSSIEAEAFAGLPEGVVVWIPAGVHSIAEGAFTSGIVIYTPAGSFAETWALNHGIPVVQWQ